MKRDLTPFQVKKFAFLNVVRDFQKDSSAICPKPPSREWPIILDSVNSTLEALADGWKAKPNIAECFDKAKLDQVTEA